jgi:hypothetical protein
MNSGTTSIIVGFIYLDIGSLTITNLDVSNIKISGYSIIRINEGTIYVDIIKS